MAGTVFDDSGACYNPERDGTLQEYLEVHNGYSCFPLFKGYSHWKMLWDEGYLVPDISIIRLMWNVGRGDEHFVVRGEFELEGISNLPAHAGREGIHDPRKMLEDDCPPWEAQTLNPRPVPRK